MAILMWFNPTWQTVHERPTVARDRKNRAPRLAAARERNDLGWLSLCTSGDSRNLDSDLGQFSLLSQGDPDTASPDPFLSDDAWRKWVTPDGGRLI
jgi:hypothetical protein